MRTEKDGVPDVSRLDILHFQRDFIFDFHVTEKYLGGFKSQAKKYVSVCIRQLKNAESPGNLFLSPFRHTGSC